MGETVKPPLTDEEKYKLIGEYLKLGGFIGHDLISIYYCVPGDPDVPGKHPKIYRWLDNDGDAFRLTMDSNVFCYTISCRKVQWKFGDIEGSDRYAAMRKAIVDTLIDFIGD